MLLRQQMGFLSGLNAEGSFLTPNLFGAVQIIIFFFNPICIECCELSTGTLNKCYCGLE